jgi:hypothetical protein
MGLADLHIHTTYSYDAVSSVPAVLKYAAHYTHLDVIAITDHDAIGGALQALDLAPAYGIEVILGIEVTTAEGHVLALFVTQVIPAGLSVEQTVLRAVELGGLCIIPNPMTRGRIGVNPRTICRALRNPEVAAGLVGVEIFNAGLAGAQRDQQAVNLCRNMPLAQVGSSDAQVSRMIGIGTTSFPGSSAEELRGALVNRQTQATGTYQMNWGDFFIRYVPQLVLRYAGWVTSNAGPSQPLRLARSPGRTQRPSQPPPRRPLRPNP